MLALHQLLTLKERRDFLERLNWMKEMYRGISLLNEFILNKPSMTST